MGPSARDERCSTGSVGQEPAHADGHDHTERGEEPEDRAPVAHRQQGTAQDRREGRRESEDHRHLAHQALCLGAGEEVADHRTRDDLTRPGREPLERAEDEQQWQRRRQGAADGGEDIDTDPHRHDGFATHGVRHRPVEQAHDGERQQVDADHLLHRGRFHVKLGAHSGERGQGRVDVEGAEQRQPGQHERADGAGTTRP